MGGFMDPFIPSPGWPQDSTVFAGLSWASSTGSLGGSSATHAMEFHLRNGSTPTFMSGGGGGSAKELGGGPVFPVGTVLSSTPAKLHEEDEEEELLLLQSDGGLDFAVDAAAAGTLGSILGSPVSLTVTDSAPVSNESSGSEQSGAGLSHFLLGEQLAAWPPAYAGIIPSIAGEETSQSFGFGGDDLLHEAAAAAACAAPNGKNNTYQHHLAPPPQLLLLQHDGSEFSCSGKLLSFAPGMDALQMDQKEFSGGLRHLDLSSLVVPGPGPPPPIAAPFNTTGGQNGAGGAAAPKPRVRARRGQATDPHSIAERLRREKISDRMKNLQELVPNSNKTDKASMLEEIIEYIKFLQLQTKVLSMSRLGATEAVVPLLTESQNESSGLLLSPRSRSGERQHGGGGGEELFQEDSAALEQEIAQLMENNMTAAMQYLQSRGLCLMPIALASAISTKKGTSSAAVWPQPSDGCCGGGDKGLVDVAGLKPLGSLKEMKYKIN